MFCPCQHVCNLCAINVKLLAAWMCNSRNSSWCFVFGRGDLLRDQSRHLQHLCGCVCVCEIWMPTHRFVHGISRCEYMCVFLGQVCDFEPCARVSCFDSHRELTKFRICIHTHNRDYDTNTCRNRNHHWPGFFWRLLCVLSSPFDIANSLLHRRSAFGAISATQLSSAALQRYKEKFIFIKGLMLYNLYI